MHIHMGKYVDEGGSFLSTCKFKTHTHTTEQAWFKDIVKEGKIAQRITSRYLPLLP